MKLAQAEVPDRPGRFLVNRLRKWGKPALTLLLALAALQTAAVLTVRNSHARKFLTQQLEKSFGRKIEVGHYSATLFPSPELTADGISVSEDPAFGQEYFLRADRLSAGLRWGGLLRGRFELGTLELQRPSLILARNAEGRWNLERWLPSAPTGTVPGVRPAGATSAPTHHLQKIEISEGRANFKLGDDKTSFAFVQVEGSVEQVATGRWELDLKAEPWRSGVPLQLAGTVRVRGDVAGTSTRLQPAHLRVSWEKGSLADVFRLVAGQDFGVRGSFSGEASAESGIPADQDSGKGSANALAPGDWRIRAQARALGIHRWDLTERDDNPRLAVRVDARWNPGAGTVTADEVVIETPRSNLRGTASLQSLAAANLEVAFDSAGVQAADFLDWYRAFRPDVADGIRGDQYFTGAAALGGWPPVLKEAAFSSPGGRWTVPGFSAPLEVRAVRGGTQRGRLVVDPFAVNIPPGRAAASPVRVLTAAAKEANNGPAAFNVSMTYDFSARAGRVRLEGQAPRVEDIFTVAAAFGRRIQNGLDLRGRAAADVQWEWAGETPGVWNGRGEFSQATMQVPGLNLPLQVETLRTEWRDARRKISFGNVAAFGTQWSGTVQQMGTVPGAFGETELPVWSFDLQAERLDTAELDRWIGPRARPGWLQRLLPSGLGGGSQPEAPNAWLRRLRASGEVRVGELTVERVKLKQFRAQANLEAAKLALRSVQAQWAGGEVKGSADAVFSSRPSYAISASFEHVNLALTPWLAPVAEHLAGQAGGSLELRAEGIGREALLASLSGKGTLNLNKVELRGWDLAGTMAVGEWKTGVSRWASGSGTFHLADGGFELNQLQLASPSEQLLLKGSVSFAADAELTAESHATGRGARAENVVRFLQISGPLAEPKVSLEKVSAQQPGD